MTYIVMIESNSAPLTMSNWTINQSFEAEFNTLSEAEMYVHSLERWSMEDSHDELWLSHGPVFRIYSEELGEFV